MAARQYLGKLTFEIIVTECCKICLNVLFFEAPNNNMQDGPQTISWYLKMIVTKSCKICLFRGFLE